jgi:toxin-antitoxin system PIN domain toxin
MIFFPDVNVWVALILAEHTHASRARRWVESAAADKLALCRVTQMSLLRLLTNSHVMSKDVFHAKDAWHVFDRLLKETNIFFAVEPPDIDYWWRELTAAGRTGSNSWTDAYLAAFAQAAGYTLVTFDRGFEGYKSIPLRILNSKP